jgi:hypothetical protein
MQASTPRDSRKLGDWFSGWAERHVKRHPAAGLPAFDDDHPMYVAWEAEFRIRGIHDEDVAEEASTRLAGRKLRHSSEHFPTLVETAVAIYAERRGPAEPVETGMGGARKRSKDCPYCDGEGWTDAWWPEETRPAGVPESRSAFCACEYGRAIRAQQMTIDAEFARKVLDYEDVLTGRSRWTTEPPWLRRYLPVERPR